MHKNQYLITSADWKLSESSQDYFQFREYKVYFGTGLQVTSAKTEATSVLILGYIIDPTHSFRTNTDIAKSLVEQCRSADQLFSFLQQLVGRFVVVFCSGEERIAVGDACGCRQIFYGFENGKIIMTSSIELFWKLAKTEPMISLDKQSVMLSSTYEIGERAWYGWKTLDDRLERLLPNFYLDLSSKSVNRIPFDERQAISHRDAHEYAAGVLRGCMAAISRRFKVVHTLTAGWDSRTSLAACKDLTDQVEFVTFAGPGMDEKTPDIYIPLRLSQRLDLNFSIKRLVKPRDQFLVLCRRENVEPQPAKAREIQFLYDHFHDSRVVRIAGLAADIMKTPYGYRHTEPSLDVLYSCTAYFRRSQFMREQIAEWFDSARDFCRCNGISVLDLFYWEQKIASWGAEYALEQDVAVEEFWPHASRNLLISVLRMPPQERLPNPDCHFYRKVIDVLWKEALDVPCNPLSFFGRLKWRAKNHSPVRYCEARLQSTLQKAR